MQYYYGDKNLLRALDEAAFWKLQESEHTAVIQAIVPDLEEQYVTALKKIDTSFKGTYGDVISYIQTIIRSNEDGENYSREIIALIRWCINQSREFINLLEMILRNSAAVSRNNTAKVVIQHIIRESKYFIGIDRLMLR